MATDAFAPLARAAEHLIRRLHPRGAALELQAALAEFTAGLAVVDDPASHDREPGEEPSLTRADALRIRTIKFVVAQLPPGAFADPALRRQIRREVHAEVAALHGGDLPPSPYLDRGPASAD